MIGSKCVHNGRPAVVALVNPDGTTVDLNYTDKNVSYPLGERTWQEVRRQHEMGVVFNDQTTHYTHKVFRKHDVRIDDINFDDLSTSGRKMSPFEVYRPDKTTLAGLRYCAFAIYDHLTK